MNITTNSETVLEIKKIMEGNADQPSNVRIYIAGSSCSGPSFGLSLDVKNEDDNEFVFEGLNFVMENSVFEQYGDFIVEFIGGGYKVMPVNAPETCCSSCSSSCSE
jgi:Fe-S cluster assembly iron-binding protein IscA